MILIINIIAVSFLERFLTSNTEANGAKLFQLLDNSASCALKVSLTNSVKFTNSENKGYL